MFNYRETDHGLGIDEGILHNFDTEPDKCRLRAPMNVLAIVDVAFG